MTVRTLIEELKSCNPDAIVYLSNPNHFDSVQEAHEEVGVRYMVEDKNGNVWFETYGDENIAEEVEAVADGCIDAGCGDDDFVRELIDPDCHGYTWSELHKNLRMKDYLWLRAAAKECGLL